MALSIWCVAVNFQAVITLHKNHIIMTQTDARPWHQQVSRFILLNWDVYWCTRNWKKHFQKGKNSQYYSFSFFFLEFILLGLKENQGYIELFYSAWTVALSSSRTQQLSCLYRGCCLDLYDKQIWFLQNKMDATIMFYRNICLRSPLNKNSGTKQYFKRNWHSVCSQTVGLDDNWSTSMNSSWHSKASICENPLYFCIKFTVLLELSFA